jgi:O-antigen/teichoic acid export membrane protein
VADAMIGQLYASRVLPVLIVSVATLIAGCVLPYLIQDWEAGKKQELRDRMNGVMKFCALGFTVIAALTHIASPLLFNVLLQGKYDHGLSLMPWGFVQYSWFSLLAIATKYLICVDKARAGILPLAAGFTSAVLMNLLLAPSWGLPGVVVAMAAANGVALAAILAVAAKCGMQWDRSALLATMLPLTMCLGGWASLGILAALLIGGRESKWLITLSEMQYLQEVWSRATGHMRSRFATAV